MLKKNVICLVILSTFLLVSCGYDSGEGPTPKEALLNLEGINVLKIYEPIQIAENRTLMVFKGGLIEVEEVGEVFVADVRGKDEKWFVAEAIGLGKPSNDMLNGASGGNYFKAGFISGDGESFNGHNQEDVQYLVEIDDSELNVWINLNSEED